jgi:two-component sensor histidine kinase
MIPREVSDIIITDELVRRHSDPPDYLREKLAFRDLADDMANNPEEVLPRLVRLAMDACGANSAGFSILEPRDREFRWFALHGSLAAFEGARTPLDFSPCGVTLAASSPVLMKHPETVYGWVRDAGISIPEVLLVPLQLGHPRKTEAIGTLWVVAPSSDFFSQEHARVLTELAAFSAVALRMIQSEERVQSALTEQEQLTAEMAHRVKNLLALTEGMLRLTARNAISKEDLVKKLSGRLQALSSAHHLVRRSFSDGPSTGVALQQVLRTVLGPYERTSTKGPEIALGDHSTNSMALVFHELATNAAKYGALGTDDGTVDISWKVTDRLLEIIWRESGGPPVQTPTRSGFGTSLVKSTIAGHHGEISYHWLKEGLLAHINFPVVNLAT